MKPTHEELLQAVREVGRSGETFTCAALRQQLGVSTQDRRKLSQFHRSFRAFQDAAGDVIEKVGPNCYRLMEPREEAVASREPAAEAAEPVQSSAAIEASAPAASLPPELTAPATEPAAAAAEPAAAAAEPAEPAAPPARLSIEAALATPVESPDEAEPAEACEPASSDVLELSDGELFEMMEAARSPSPLPSLREVVFTELNPAQPSSEDPQASVNRGHGHEEAASAALEQAAAVESAASVSEQLPAVDRTWRVRMRRLGRRMKRLFGGSSPADTGAAAQA
jgi:hypothetical protein